MRLIYLACCLSLTTLYQVQYSNARCGCGTQTCTNVQVGYHTFISDWCYNLYPTSEYGCYTMLYSPNVWIVNYKPDSQECRVSECDTTYAIRRSIYGMIMYRKTCDTGCLNYTLAYYDYCWTQPSPPAVLELQYIASSEIECLQNCLPPTKSCIVAYDSNSQECEVFENVDTSDSPSCIQTGSSQITYYVTCYDNVQVRTCETPDTISNGNVNYTDMSISSTATYYCDIGYELFGTATITCQADLQWSTPLPNCQIVDCNTPPTVAQAVVSPADPSAISISTIYGSSVTYRCETGYNLSGSPYVYCLDSGAWESTLPSCQIVDCNGPPTVTHATVDAMTTTYNSTATYTCAAQYTLVGTATVSCSDDGQWGPSVPSCSLVDCQAPPNVTHATVDAMTTTYNSTATYTCAAQYTIVGTAIVSCLDDGQWGPSVPSCSLVDCQAPPNVTHATVVAMTTTYNSTATYTCAAQYTIVGTATVSCLDDGQWGPSIPSCSLVDCQAPPNVTHATVDAMTTTYNSTATYTCAAQYTLVGTAIVSCLDDGQWGPSIPSCSLVDCQAPPNVTHATVDAMTTTYNSTATYTCAAQYTLVGTATVSCLDDGQWGPSIPSCSLVDCQAPPNVTNATVSFTATTYGSYATYTCFTSHARVGPPTIACQGDGTWTQPMVLCAPKGNSVNTPPRALYITPCACSTGSFFINMTEDEIIAKLIADTAINSKETTLSQYSLKSRPDNRTSSLISGIIGIAVLSIIFGTMLCIDLLKLYRYFKRNGTE